MIDIGNLSSTSLFFFAVSRGAFQSRDTVLRLEPLSVGALKVYLNCSVGQIEGLQTIWFGEIE